MTTRKLKAGDPVLTPGDEVGVILYPNYGTAETPAKDMWKVKYLGRRLGGAVIEARESNFWETELTLMQPVPEDPTWQEVAVVFREYLQACYLPGRDEVDQRPRREKVKSYLEVHGVTSASQLKPEQRAAAIAYVQGLIAVEKKCVENWSEAEDFGGEPGGYHTGGFVDDLGEDLEGDRAHSREEQDGRHVDAREAQSQRVAMKDLKRISFSFTPDGEGKLDPAQTESNYHDRILQSIIEAFRVPSELLGENPDRMSNADLQVAIDNTYAKLKPGPFDGRREPGGEHKKVLDDHLTALLLVQRQRLGLES